MGKKAESFILDWLSKRDKWTYVARFSDNYDANKGRWGKDKLVNVGRKPSDAIAILGGVTWFLEVKTTTNEKGLTSSLFKYFSIISLAAIASISISAKSN